VAIRGGADDRWAEAYRALCEQSPEHARFAFDRRSGTIAFSCLTAEGPTMVFEMLEQLEALLELVDWRAEGQQAEAAPNVAPIAFRRLA
jgi:hypothetical protein